MDLSKVVAISGKPGLYKVVANRDNGLIVEDFDTGKKRFIPSRKHQFTPLESISIYTSEDTEELKVIFKSMESNLESNPPVSGKASPEETIEYFTKILPEFDQERVYVSDIKKLIKWFNFLKDRNLLVDEDVEKPDPSDQNEEE